MKKIIVEYKKDEVIELTAVQIEPEKRAEVEQEVVSLGGIIESMDADSIHATIVDGDLWNIYKSLCDKGWGWY